MLSQLIDRLIRAEVLPPMAALPDKATMRQPVAKPEPVPHEPCVGVEEYSQLAKSIGFQNASTARRSIIDFMMREEIPIYNLKRVTDYMDSLVPIPRNRLPIGTAWRWNPLRDKDCFTRGPDHVQIGPGNGIWAHPNGIIMWATQYQGPVPATALKATATLSRQFKDCRFVVANLQEVLTPRPVDGDPFLAIWFPEMDLIPFAVWDEPGF